MLSTLHGIIIARYSNNVGDEMVHGRLEHHVSFCGSTHEPGRGVILEERHPANQDGATAKINLMLLSRVGINCRALWRLSPPGWRLVSLCAGDTSDMPPRL
jgi:hypothetical protein